MPIELKLTVAEWAVFHRHLALIVTDLQTRPLSDGTIAEVVHYDLHPGNTLVLVGQLQTWTYTCYGQIYTIESPFMITLIDFGSTHVNRMLGVDDGLPPMPDHWYESRPGSLYLGRIPSVYDPIADVAFILAQHAAILGNRIQRNPVTQLSSGSMIQMFNSATETIATINKLLILEQLTPYISKGQQDIAGFAKLPMIERIFQISPEVMPDPGCYWYTEQRYRRPADANGSADNVITMQRYMGSLLAQWKRESITS